MKSIFNTIIYYIFGTLTGIILAALIYMICCDLTLLVAGIKLKFFNGDFFIRGLIVSFPLVVSLVIGLIFLYGVRHPKNHYLRLFTYIFLCSLTWLVLIPLSFDLGKKYNETLAKKYEVPALSSGYFRKEAGGVFFFSRVGENQKADGVFIDLTGITGEQGNVIRFTNSIIDEDFSGQFADTLIRDAIKLPFVIVAPLELYSTVIGKAQTAWEKGYIEWLVFLTFILSLCSVVSFQYISVWRLINALAILFAAGLICLINYAYHYGILFKSAAVSWSAYFSQLSQNYSGFISKLLAADNPLLAVINLIIFAVLLFSGIIIYFVNQKRKGGRK